jgi:hypothetical protein
MGMMLKRALVFLAAFEVGIAATDGPAFSAVALVVATWHLADRALYRWQVRHNYRIDGRRPAG